MFNFRLPINSENNNRPWWPSGLIHQAQIQVAGSKRIGPRSESHLMHGTAMDRLSMEYKINRPESEIIELNHNIAGRQVNKLLTISTQVTL